MDHQILSDPISVAPLMTEPTLTLHRRQPQDTSAGCRARAAADLSRAAELTGDHVRWRYQHSAQAWLARADLLDRLEAKFQARLRDPRR